ncbi:MAG TPA: PEP-CTERM sorting domain-containing protein [Rubrivivax sp.]|nr:PEP-CTERM sorting domain-containing protein [Rubrivivax sp.]
MTSKLNKVCGAVLAASALTIGSAGGTSAATVSWTDWTTASTDKVEGTLAAGGSNVGVTFNGTYSFAITGAGTNYWMPNAPYLSGVVSNAPPASDIIGLNVGGKASITFSQAVIDPLIALVSWNGNTVDFGVPIEILSYGGGYWGNGTPMLNTAGTGFYGNGEVHGVIRLPGTYTSLSFTHTSENWHGLTVGVVGLADNNQVPEPTSIALVGLALLALAVRARRQNS